MCQLRFALHAATAPASPRRIPCFGLALARPAAPSAGAVEKMSANMIKPVLAEVGGRGLLRPMASFIMRSLSAICQTGHTALPNGPFCVAIWPVWHSRRCGALWVAGIFCASIAVACHFCRCRCHARHGAHRLRAANSLSSASSALALSLSRLTNLLPMMAPAE